MATRDAANDEKARYWNAEEGAHGLAHEQRYERMLAPFTGHLLTAAAIGVADRVIDIGCGIGSKTPTRRPSPGSATLWRRRSSPILRRTA